MHKLDFLCFIYFNNLYYNLRTYHIKFACVRACVCLQVRFDHLDNTYTVQIFTVGPDVPDTTYPIQRTPYHLPHTPYYIPHTPYHVLRTTALRRS